MMTFPIYGTIRYSWYIPTGGSPTAGSDQATDVEFCRGQAQQMTLARYDVARKRAVLNLNEENMGRYGKPDVIYI